MTGLTPQKVAALPLLDLTVATTLLSAAQAGANLQTGMEADFKDTVGSDSNELKYSLPSKSSIMAATGTFAGQPVSETFDLTDPTRIPINGSIGSDAENLCARFAGGAITLDGSIGAQKVHETITVNANQNTLVADGTVGDATLHEEMAYGQDPRGTRYITTGSIGSTPVEQDLIASQTRAGAVDLDGYGILAGQPTSTSVHISNSVR